MRRFLLFLGSALLFLPAWATAQAWSDYPLFIEPKAFVSMPIPGGEPVQQLSWGTDIDFRSEVVTLPFPVTYGGVLYDRILVSADGFISFGGITDHNTAGNKMVPHSDNPNNAVFLFHDDLVLDHGPKTQVVGMPGAREFGIEFSGIRWNTTFRFKMQVWLSEGSPLIRVLYGPKSGASGGSTITASLGVENISGTLGTPGLQPDGSNCNPPTPSSSSSTGCSEAGFPSGYEYRYGVTAEADLRVSVTLGVVTEINDGTQLRIPITSTINNYGLAQADGVVWNYYFNQGTNFNPNAPLIEPAHETGESIPGLGTRSFTDVRVYPMPPVGEYRVCAWVNPAGTVEEANYGNNTICSTNPITIGADLIAESAAWVNASTSLPGDLVTMRFRMRNGGTKPSGTFKYELLVAAQPVGGDRQVVFEAMHPGLAPGEVYEDTMQVRIPTNLLGEQFYPFLRLNNDKKTTEANYNNNTASGTTAVRMLLPNVEMSNVSIVGDCYFGRELEVGYKACNTGQATAMDFARGFLIHEISVAPTSLDKMTLMGATPEVCQSDNDCTELNQGVCVGSSLVGTVTVGLCHYGCVSNEDCGLGLSCLPDHGLGGLKVCQNALAVGQCVTTTETVIVPTVDYLGEPLRENHDYMVTGFLDLTQDLNEGDASKTVNNYSRTQKFQCRLPAPDLVATSMLQPSRLAAGETVAIHRKIENLGNEAATIDYRYVLTTNDIGSKADILLPLVSTGGDGVVSLAPGAADERSDLVHVPSYVKAQEYYLALVIDPDRTLRELDKTNNSFVSSSKIHVEPSVLQIRNVVLPEGTLGQSYHHQLVATGGTDRYVWSARNLPYFLSLSESGVLKAEQLVDDGRHNFTVIVTSGSLSVEAPVVLEVGLPRGPLALESTRLPHAYTHSNSPYDAPIAISGGVPPYECTFTGLPNRFRQKIAQDGKTALCAVVANAGLEITGDHQFKVSVVDAKGTTVGGQLELSVLDGRMLAFNEMRLFDGYVGESGYRSCVKVIRSKLHGTEGLIYSWSARNLPAGIAIDPASRDIEGCLIGEPLECGSFMVNMRVETRLGEDGEVQEAAEADTPLTVHCRNLALEYDPLAPVHRGDSVDMQLRATGPNAANATFRIYSGQLPDGIVLEANGRLHGIIGENAEYGSHTVIIEIDDGAGGKGLSGFAILVQPRRDVPPPPPPPNKSSCSTAGGAEGALPLGLLVLGLAIRSRRRVEGN